MAFQEKLNEQLELCMWLYDRLLEELNGARKKDQRLWRWGLYSAFQHKL